MRFSLLIAVRCRNELLGLKKVKLPLKGQSHKKVDEMRVQGDSLGPN
jgi:hypothetical protein